MAERDKVAPSKKRKNEMKIFRGFACAAKLGIDPGSERNEEPPLPDISCTIQGVPRFYELGEITDQGLARDLSINGVSSTGVFLNEQGLLTRMLGKKGISSYQTNGVPIDLILHYDKQFPFEDPNGHLQEADVVAALLPNGPFSRVWIYDSWDDAVLWSR